MRVLAWMKGLYSWHRVVPWGTRRVLIVTPDSPGITAVILAVTTFVFFLYPDLFASSFAKLAVGAVVVLLLSPLYLWQVMAVSAEGVTILRTLLLIPFWVRKIPEGAEPRLSQGHDDREPTGISFHWAACDAEVGNGWNARALLDEYQRCRERLSGAVQSAVSPGDGP